MTYNQAKIIIQSITENAKIFTLLIISIVGTRPKITQTKARIIQVSIIHS
jgi:hypothetical protein